MVRSTNKLTDKGVRAFVARHRSGTASTKRIPDGGGLFLLMTPAGSACWRIKYRFGGKEMLHSAGQYPDVSLEAARAERAAVRALLRAGQSPAHTRRMQRAAAAFAADNTFGAVARVWLEKKRGEWSKVHYDKSKRALERDVLPVIGRLPVAEISSGMVAGVVQSVAKRGVADTASKILQHIGGVFEYAQALDLCKSDPSIPVRQLLPKRRAVVRRPALLNFDALRDLLRRAEIAPLSPSVRLAQRLIAYTGQRIWNAVSCEWTELDLDSDPPIWTIPRQQMKVKDRPFDHSVILGPTIAAELRRWRDATGGVGVVFPSPAGEGHVTREALEKAYKVTLGMRDVHSLHGWRASLATLARDAGFTRDVVAVVLDHEKDTAVRRAYDRGDRLAERIKLMAWWDSELSRPAGTA